MNRLIHMECHALFSLKNKNNNKVDSRLLQICLALSGLKVLSATKLLFKIWSLIYKTYTAILDKIMIYK